MYKINEERQQKIEQKVLLLHNLTIIFFWHKALINRSDTLDQPLLLFSFWQFVFCLYKCAIWWAVSNSFAFSDTTNIYQPEKFVNLLTSLCLVCVLIKFAFRQFFCKAKPNQIKTRGFVCISKMCGLSK